MASGRRRRASCGTNFTARQVCRVNQLLREDYSSEQVSGTSGAPASSRSATRPAARASSPSSIARQASPHRQADRTNSRTDQRRPQPPHREAPLALPSNHRRQRLRIPRLRASRGLIQNQIQFRSSLTLVRARHQQEYQRPHLTESPPELQHGEPDRGRARPHRRQAQRAPQKTPQLPHPSRKIPPRTNTDFFSTSLLDLSRSILAVGSRICQERSQRRWRR